MPAPSANRPLLPASLFGLCQVSTTTADPETSFNMQTPEAGPHPEGDTAQRVHIKSCLLEDATIGNSNKMTIHSRSKGGVVESADSKEPKEDTGKPRRGSLCVPRPQSLEHHGRYKDATVWSSASGLKPAWSSRLQGGCRYRHPGNKEPQKGFEQD